MNVTGDAAEQTFRIVIEETEFVIRIAGSLLKETIAMLYAISKDNKQNSIGRTNLSNMLKNCKDIRIFTVQKKDLNKFIEEAKNYGIYYCTLLDKTNRSDDGIVDILVRGDDAPRVNRIIEKFALGMKDTAELHTKSVKEKGKEEIINQDDKTENIQIVDDNTLADIMGENLNEKITNVEERNSNINDEMIADIMGMKPIIDDEKMAEIMGQVQVIEGVKDGVSDTFLHNAEALSDYSFENKKEKTVKNEGRVSTRELLKAFASEIKQKVNEYAKEIINQNKKDKINIKNDKMHYKDNDRKIGVKKNDKTR